MVAVRVVLLLALLLALDLRAAHATSCIEPELGPSSANADVVFVATVASEKDHSVYGLSVERVYKGEVPKSVKARGGGMKGASFQRGKRFLVFARLDPSDAEAPLFAHLCGGTQLAEQVRDWMTKLGDGSTPGTTLASGSAAAAPAPEAAPEPVPAPEPEPAPEPVSAPPLEPEPEPAPAPAPLPAPADAGCAACALGAASPGPSATWLALGLGAAFATRRATNAKRPRRSRSMLRP
ncbi:MAG: hypothetical protein AMXMBFR56_29420 [Polyangiaceae bacterium]